MQKDSETAFLKKRKGFIRIAMQCGSAVVPCFAFGQGGTYSWYRPGPPLLSDSFVQAMSRRIGECVFALKNMAWSTVTKGLIV
jgi:2-acylglycerol O-acyltransferase 2